MTPADKTANDYEGPPTTPIPVSDTDTRATWKEWAGLALLVLPMLMVASDLTVLFLALPTLSADLDTSASQGMWITHIYTFVIGALLVTAGRVGDRIGPRRLLLIGGAAFGVLSAVAAFSVNAEMLIIARALLGVAGATLMPSLFSLLRTMFTNETQRRFAVAIMFSSFSVGGALGPLMGGALLEFFWWGSVFLINVPFMASLLLLGPWLLPERTERNTGGFDVPSIVLSIVGIFALVYGLQELATGQQTGEGTVWVNISIATAGVLALWFFIRRQRQLTEPLFDMALLADRRVGPSLGAVLVFTIGAMGIYFLVTQYLQLVIGLTPLQAGLATLPFVAFNILGALLAPALAKKMRPAVVVALGLGTATVGGILVAVTAGADTGLPAIIAALSVIAIGQGGGFALIVDLIISSAPAEKVGSVSAAQEVSAEMGHGLGIAAGGALGTVFYRAWLETSIPSQVPETAADSALASLHGGVTTAENLGSTGPALLEVVHEAIGTGLQNFAIIGAAFMGLAALLIAVVLVFRDRPRHRGQHSRDDGQETTSVEHEQETLIKQKER
ncbi:MFS transporter [Nesterenkonia ebinurensis]|uniref:MFS transporter n=1 Tax=Nesterenkonia ebinurensis TaxID=2608252 RepID=UPI00123D1D22|nr:MFS transporter [Nesterenkonia ebinurensis]